MSPPPILPSLLGLLLSRPPPRLPLSSPGSCHQSKPVGQELVYHLYFQGRSFLSSKFPSPSNLHFLSRPLESKPRTKQEDPRCPRTEHFFSGCSASAGSSSKGDVPGLC